MPGLNSSKSSWKGCVLTPPWWVCRFSQSQSQLAIYHWDSCYWHNEGGQNVPFGDSVALYQLQVIIKPLPLDVIL